MSAKGERMRERAEAVVKLREWLPPGSTVYAVLRHVARSGMSWRIDLYRIADNAPVWLSGYVKTALGYPRTKYDAVTVGGCGMDMGFHLVYNLSSALYPDGFRCIGPKCPSNDHGNGDSDYTPDPGENPPATWEECGGCDCYHPPTFGGDCRDDANRWPWREHWHKDGGYALRHRWM